MQVTPAGFEQSHVLPEKVPDGPCGGAEYGALNPDPDFAELRRVWPTLPELLRKVILQLIRAQEDR
jgi:hypothetical protein